MTQLFPKNKVVKPFDTSSRSVRMNIGQQFTVLESQRCQMVKKSDVVRELVGQHNYQKALSIAKDFRLGITPAESSTMRRAYECMVHERFYRSIGTDVPQAIKDGTEILIRLYGRSGKHDLHEQIPES